MSIEDKKLLDILKAAVDLVCSEAFEAKNREEKNLEKILLECGMIEQVGD